MSKYSASIRVSGVKATVNRLNRYTKSGDLMQAVLDKAEQIVRQNLTNYPGLSSQVTKNSTDTGGNVYVNADYAKYIEFGTGVVGRGASHPLSAELAWIYDINNHGEQGWYYKSGGQWHWTKGQTAKQFMYNSAKELERAIPSIVKEAFKK